jgi:FkbM family methyltransferase
MNLNKSQQYFSQYNQDKISDILLKSKTQGFFVDIGAHDGISLSNSYFFELNRNYNGICFEPNPDVFQKLKNNRRCECVNAAISEKTEIVKFLKCTGPIEMLSGISKYREEKHIERTNKDIENLGGEINEIEVQAINLNEILSEKKINEVDFLSLDIEGGEYNVLTAIDFRKLKVKIIAVEMAFLEVEEIIRPYLHGKGFLFLCRTGSDGIFINQEEFNTFSPTIIKYLIFDRIIYYTKAFATALGYKKLVKALVKK